jgi:hypothetical protein
MKAIKFRVVLDFEEDVFRDLLISEEDNFENFHNEILRSFGFPNNQMASFYMSNEKWDKGEEIPLFDMNEEFGPEPLPTMSTLFLNEKLSEVGQRMVYVYDFMLMWCFFVEVISIEETKEQLPMMLTIFGEAPDAQDKEPDIQFEAVLSKSIEEEDEEEEEDDIFGDFEDGFDEDDLR